MSENEKSTDPIDALESEIGEECRRVMVGTPESAMLVVASAILVIAKELRTATLSLYHIHMELTRMDR